MLTDLTTAMTMLDDLDGLAFCTLFQHLPKEGVRSLLMASRSARAEWENPYTRIKCYVGWQSDDDENVLYWAVRRGSVDIVRCLLSLPEFSEADQPIDDALCVASFCGHQAVIDVLIEKGACVEYDSCQAIQWAACEGRDGIVRCLIARGADVRADEDAPLICAAANDRVEVAKTLISCGADVHARNGFPLEVASQHGCLDMVAFLMGGATTQEMDRALLVASEWGELGVVEMLLAGGATKARTLEVLRRWDGEAWSRGRRGHEQVIHLLVHSLTRWTATDWVCSTRGDGTTDS